MSAPAIVGSLIFEGKDAIEMGYLAELALVPTLIGVAVAAALAVGVVLFLKQRRS